MKYVYNLIIEFYNGFDCYNKINLTDMALALLISLSHGTRTC